MAKFLLVYHGGSMAETPEAQAASMNTWIAWFTTLGAAVVDGGAPTSRAWTIQSGGTSEGGGANPATGYSVISAESMDAASELAKGCPIIAEGGTVELCETIDLSGGR